jgi:hypothetical protein
VEIRAIHRQGLALLACLALAASLRFVDLGAANVWEDEAVAYKTARLDGPSALLKNLIATDATRAPLHLLILQGLFRVFGKSLLVGRAFSATCGVAAVAMVYLLARQAFDRKTALLACFLAALNPLDVHHSRELRMYECLVLLTCACWALLFSFRQGAGRGKQAAYALSMAGLCYAHPLGGLMVIALAMGYLILREDLQLTLVSWISIHVALGVMLSPWVLRYFDHGPQEFPRPLTARLLLEWPEGFTGGNAEAAWVGVALVIGGIVATRRARREEGRPERWPVDRTSGALLAWFLVPFLLLLTYTLTRHPIFGERRYLLYVGPAYLLLAARGLSALPTRPRVAVLVAFLFFNVQALDRRVFNIYRPDLRTAAGLAESHDPLAPIVVVDSNRNNLYKCLETYRNPSLPGRVVSVRRWLAALAKPEASPEPTVWFAIERPKNLPRKPLPPALARLYVAEQTYELPYLTLTYNRLIRRASTEGPARR